MEGGNERRNGTDGSVAHGVSSSLANANSQGHEYKFAAIGR
jgi:hypothetical protein